MLKNLVETAAAVALQINRFRREQTQVAQIPDVQRLAGRFC